MEQPHAPGAAPPQPALPTGGKMPLSSPRVLGLRDQIQQEKNEATPSKTKSPGSVF